MFEEVRRVPTVVAVSAGSGFAVLLVLVALGWAPLMVLDQAVVDAANAALSPRPGLVAVVRGVTDAGSPFAVDLLTGVAAVVLLATRRFRAATYLVAVRLLELAAETAVKNLLDRPRPVPEVVLATASGAAFPSGHTAGTAALCASVLMLARPALVRARRRAWVLAVSAAVLAVAGVAASRVLLGVHYPSDVVGGALLGMVCAAVLTAWLRRPP